MQSAFRIKDEFGRTRQLSVKQAMEEASAKLTRGENQGALSLLEKVIHFVPFNPRIWHAVGEAQTTNGKTEDAIQTLQKVVSADRTNADYRFSLAKALMPSRPAEAIPHLLATIALDTAHGKPRPDPYCDLAVILIHRNQREEALKVCDLGLHNCPDNAEILCNRGLALALFDRYEEALACGLRARDLRPGNAIIWSNLGTHFYNLERVQEAEECARQACALESDLPGAHYNLATSLLVAGHFREGFREYEWRWKSVLQEHVRTYAQPLWDGADLAGKRILLWAEQGMGDAIQFVRYAAQVRSRGGDVLLEMPKSLVRLMSWMPERFEIVTPNSGAPQFDVQCPLLSLPWLCGTEKDSIPAPASFCIPDEMRRKWAQKLAGAQSPKIALIWAGSPTHGNDRNRSIPLRAFLPILNLPGLRFFSLQVGPASAQLYEPGFSSQIEDLSPLLTDYAETAGALSQMDLVISVDTSVVHLAGSLGVPVWTLLPFAPDWRWMLHRTDSPWYSSLRLFRQQTPGDWSTVINKVALELSNAGQPAPDKV